MNFFISLFFFTTHRKKIISLSSLSRFSKTVGLKKLPFFSCFRPFCSSGFRRLHFVFRNTDERSLRRRLLLRRTPDVFHLSRAPNFPTDQENSSDDADDSDENDDADDDDGLCRHRVVSRVAVVCRFVIGVWKKYSFSPNLKIQLSKSSYVCPKLISAQLVEI